MTSQLARILGVALLIGSASVFWGQERPAIPPVADPAATRGVEVQARGPIHEAFATPQSEPQPTPMIPRKPPTPIEELAPEERPEGDAAWIGGYWAWDDERRDFLWVSGCWRVKPAGKEWLPGYWRETSGQFQWVNGFWMNAQQDRQQEMTYYPQPPAPPQIAAPPPTTADEFHVPGYWMWHGDRYVWRAGYVTRVRPGYVYVASHYRWTPGGYVFIPGYWDYAIAQRGLLYAPIVVDPDAVGPAFVYTPRYAVTDSLVMDSFFVRPAYGHYYFGDYYGANYVQIGFVSGVVYSRSYYEPIVVYRQWEYRATPRWLEVQVAIHNDRAHGRAPLPPRTLVQQNTIVQNNVTVNNTVNNVTNNRAPGLASASTVLASRGQTSVPLDAAARTQVQKSASTAQQSLATGRQNLERPTATPSPQPRAATLNVPANTVTPGRTPPTAQVPKQSPTQIPIQNSMQNPAPAPKRDIPPAKRDIQQVGGGETPRGLPAAKPNAAAPPPAAAADPRAAPGLPKGPAASQPPSSPAGTGPGRPPTVAPTRPNAPTPPARPTPSAKQGDDRKK